MLVEPVKLQIPTEVTTSFKKKAKEAFPNETFAYLLGKDDDGRYAIHELFFPDDVQNYCRPGYVDIQDSWIRKARRYAKANDFVVLGDVHSHPYDRKEMEARKPHSPDTSPSEQDWERSSQYGALMGICLVTETKDHKLRARLKWWGPMSPVVVRET